MKLYSVRKTVFTNTSIVTEGTKVYFHHIDKFVTARGTLALTLTKNQMRLVEKYIDNDLNV